MSGLWAFWEDGELIERETNAHPLGQEIRIYRRGDFMFSHVHPTRALAEADAAEDRQESTMSPDLTFTALPAHLIASAISPERFGVEVCLPKLQKLFGVIARAKFYTFENLNPDSVAGMIHAFCSDSLEYKHSFFESAKRT